MENKNFLEMLFKESESYNSLESIDGLLQSGISLENHPIEPLYMGLKSLSPEVTSLHLCKLSDEQRTAFLDIDLWTKDFVNPKEFGYWIETYSMCPEEEIRKDFIKSPEFMLYLKARINIWTFDVDEPLYPDHDNYFLTEDMMLLVEFNEDFEYVMEVKNFIKELYADLGVENAYASLFKMVADTYSILAEEEYQLKKHRLNDYGFVDYYDALEWAASFPSRSHIDNFIKTKKPVTGAIDSVAQSQAIPTTAIISYKDRMDSIFNELNKVTDEKRKAFLNFDFIRLVNATITLDDALKAGSVAMARVGKKSRTNLLLGLDYIRSKVADDDSEGIFSKYLFSDLYKIGSTLIQLNQRKLNKSISTFGFESGDDVFLGRKWNEFLDASFDTPVKLAKVLDEGDREIISMEQFGKWNSIVDTFTTITPFIKRFKEAYDELVSTNSIQDAYYLNYAIAEIDFEALILSSFANFVLGSYDTDNNPKLGISVAELKKFSEIFIKTGITENREDVLEIIGKFKVKFGFESAIGFEKYLIDILREHLEGYDYSSLVIDDFKHVGGPILLFED